MIIVRKPIPLAELKKMSEKMYGGLGNKSRSVEDEKIQEIIKVIVRKLTQ